MDSRGWIRERSWGSTSVTWLFTSCKTAGTWRLRRLEPRLKMFEIHIRTAVNAMSQSIRVITLALYRLFTPCTVDNQLATLNQQNVHYCSLDGGRDSAVGIATRYGLDGPGMESRWGDEIFRTRPDRPWGPPSLLYKGYRVFPGGKAAGAWRWTPTPI
jgi:hypothetical protein